MRPLLVQNKQLLNFTAAVLFSLYQSFSMNLLLVSHEKNGVTPFELDVHFLTLMCRARERKCYLFLDSLERLCAGKTTALLFMSIITPMNMSELQYWWVQTASINTILKCIASNVILMTINNKQVSECIWKVFLSCNHRFFVASHWRI